MAAYDLDELPDPIYLRLNSNALGNYGAAQGGYYSEDSGSGDEGSVSDDNIQFDLSAPPPES